MPDEQLSSRRTFLVVLNYSHISCHKPWRAPFSLYPTTPTVEELQKDPLQTLAGLLFLLICWNRMMRKRYRDSHKPSRASSSFSSRARVRSSERRLLSQTLTGFLFLLAEYKNGAIDPHLQSRKPSRVPSAF